LYKKKEGAYAGGEKVIFIIINIRIKRGGARKHPCSFKIKRGKQAASYFYYYNNNPLRKRASAQARKRSECLRKRASAQTRKRANAQARKRASEGLIIFFPPSFFFFTKIRPNAIPYFLF
jgi:hypothetical protein